MDKSLCNPRKSVADLDFRSSSRVLLRACSACPILPKDSPIRKIRKMPASPEQLLLQLFVIFVAATLLGEFFERVRLPRRPAKFLPELRSALMPSQLFRQVIRFIPSPRARFLSCSVPDLKPARTN